MRRRRRKKVMMVCIVLFALVVIVVGVRMENINGGEEGEKKDFLVPFLFREILYETQPLFSYLSRGGKSVSPLGDYLWDHADPEDVKEYHIELLKKENEVAAVERSFQEEREVSDVEEEEIVVENTTENMSFDKTEFLLWAGCGFVSNVEAPVRYIFKPATVKSKSFEQESLSDFEFVIEEFYTVDASTSPVAMSNISQILSYDCTIDKTREGPQILIYHTHSREEFADSVSGDSNTLIQGAGKYLAEILREHYGYSVYHHTGAYDVDTRDDAYAKAAPAIEQILEQYPQIQVIIDLHRDGVAQNRHLVHEVQGLQMAQFMFFNGLSYSNKSGELTYLPNENLQANLALSLKLGIAANEYYPGLARNNYLNAYRYNMHYRDKTLLIELGAQTNTIEEIRNACLPLAHVLDIVLSGKETYQ